MPAHVKAGAGTAQHPRNAAHDALRGRAGGAWSLFEEEVLFGMGRRHRHDWDEAYYILEGESDFESMDRRRVTTGDFNYLPRNTVHGFKGASATPARC